MNSLSDIMSSQMQQYKDSLDATDDNPPTYENQPEHTSHTLVTNPTTTPASAIATSNQTTITNGVDISHIKKVVYSLKNELDSLLRFLDGETQHRQSLVTTDTIETQHGDKIVEGVFTGEKMLGADGKEYSVPPNYASKSKLVEGDMMKLTITPNGSFVYKQIGPINRKRLVGELICDFDTSQWSVMAEGRSYKILNASVSFHKGSAGDEAVILVPESGESEWAAVENVIHAA